jgi:hypothetical protein
LTKRLSPFAAGPWLEEFVDGLGRTNGLRANRLVAVMFTPWGTDSIPLDVLKRELQARISSNSHLNLSCFCH